MPLKITHILNGSCCPECLSIPVVLRPPSQFTLFVYGAIRASGTKRIRQRVLKRREQIIETPPDYHVIIHGDQNAHDRWSKPHTTQVGVNSFPHTDGTLAEALADGELQKQKGYAKQDHTDKIWNEKCTWRRGRKTFLFYMVFFLVPLWLEEPRYRSGTGVQHCI